MSLPPSDPRQPGPSPQQPYPAPPQQPGQAPYPGQSYPGQPSPGQQPWLRDETPTTVAPWAPVAPVGAPPPTASVSRGRPVRWAIALGATAVVAVAAVAFAVFATGGRTPAVAQGPTYLPQSTVAYVEARLDLPGDQRDNLVSFLSRFPGFGDRTTFEQKINDTLDRLTREASDDRLTYTGDISPWLAGDVSIGVLRWPDMTGGFMAETAPPIAGALSLKDRAAAEAFLARMRTDAEARGGSFSESAGNGATVVTYQSGDADKSFSYAVTDNLLIFGMDAADVRTALDVRANAQPALAESEAFAAQFNKLPAARLGAVYVDLRPLREQLQRAAAEMGGGAPMLAIDQLPTTMVGSLRSEGDRMALDLRQVMGSTTLPLPGVRDSGLYGRVPSSTVVYYETHDLGTQLRSVIGQFKSQAGPALPQEQLVQLEQFLGAPLEEYLSWVQDVGVAVSMPAADHFEVGLVASVTDEAVARQRIERLTAAARAALAFGGDVPIEIVDEQISGAAVTTIRLSPQAGAQVPPNLPVTPTLSYTVHNGLFMLGVGDFVSGALQRTPADSLASNADFTAAITAAGGANNGGSMYVDVGKLFDLLDAQIASSAGPSYETEIRPYTDPLDRLAAVWTVQDGAVVMRVLLYVE